MAETKNIKLAAALSAVMTLQAETAMAEEEHSPELISNSIHQTLDVQSLRLAFSQNSFKEQFKAARNGEGTIWGGLYRDKTSTGTFIGFRLVGDEVQKGETGFSVNIGHQKNKPLYERRPFEARQSQNSFGLQLNYKF